MNHVLVRVIGAAVIFSLGWLLATLVPVVSQQLGARLDGLDRRMAALQAQCAAAPETPQAPNLVTIDSSSLKAELVAALRSELSSRAEPAGKAADRSAVAEAEAPAVAEDALRSFDDGIRLIASATAAHRWGENDAQMFRAVMSRLDSERQQELLKTLVPKLNSGELRNDTRGVAF